MDVIEGCAAGATAAVAGTASLAIPRASCRCSSAGRAVACKREVGFNSPPAPPQAHTRPMRPRAHRLQHVLEGPAAWPVVDAAGYAVTATRFDLAALPDPREVNSVVAMGGPMSVNDERAAPAYRGQRVLSPQANRCSGSSGAQRSPVHWVRGYRTRSGIGCSRRRPRRPGLVSPSGFRTDARLPLVWRDLDLPPGRFGSRAAQLENWLSAGRSVIGPQFTSGDTPHRASWSRIAAGAAALGCSPRRRSSRPHRGLRVDQRVDGPGAGVSGGPARGSTLPQAVRAGADDPACWNRSQISRCRSERTLLMPSSDPDPVAQFEIDAIGAESHYPAGRRRFLPGGAPPPPPAAAAPDGSSP